MGHESEQTIYGNKVYISSPHGTLSEETAGNLARFVDVQLHGVSPMTSDESLESSMQPAGITFLIDENLAYDKVVVHLSAENARLALALNPKKLSEMTDFTKVPPSLLQHLYAGAAVIGMYQHAMQENKPIDLTNQIEMYRKMIDIIGDYFLDIAHRTGVTIEVISSKDIPSTIV